MIVSVGKSSYLPLLTVLSYRCISTCTRKNYILTVRTCSRLITGLHQSLAELDEEPNQSVNLKSLLKSICSGEFSLLFRWLM